MDGNHSRGGDGRKTRGSSRRTFLAALVETLRSLDEPVPTDEALDIARGL
ncbi:hypothetical protein [Haloferax volcanii]